MPRKKPSPPSPLDPIDSCKYCQKSHLKLSRCSRCKEVLYCSVDCQKTDWAEHKGTCNKPKTSEQKSADPPLPNNEESCDSCGKSGDKLRTCSQCKKAKYCSKECQRAQWPEHKVDCKKKVARTPQMFESLCRICLKACGDSGYCKECIIVKDLNNLFPLEVPTDVSQRARRMYRDFELVTEFEDINPFDHYTFTPNKQILLALLYEPGGHPGRPSMDLRDETGAVYPLIFYLDEDDQPTVNFRDKFVPGNYICIPYPYIHSFLSGFDGFRINSIKAVNFFEPR